MSDVAQALAINMKPAHSCRAQVRMQFRAAGINTSPRTDVLTADPRQLLWCGSDSQLDIQEAYRPLQLHSTYWLILRLLNSAPIDSKADWRSEEFGELKNPEESFPAHSNIRFCVDELKFPKAMV